MSKLQAMENVFIAILCKPCSLKFAGCDPVWKVCIVQPRSRLRSFDVPYIFYSKFSKSRARNLQTFQSGLRPGCYISFEWEIKTVVLPCTLRN